MIVSSLSTLQAGLERLSPPAFFKAVCNWKVSDVKPANFKEFPPKETLPFQSVVHLLDNFYRLEEHLTLSDIPSFDHPFLNNETTRKMLYHQVVPLTSGWITTPNDYIFKNMQLQKNLDNWRMTQGSKYVIKRQLDDCNVKDSSLVIINHNPIFRLFCRGIMTNWRCVEHFLASCFNTVQHLPDKTHYFLIPLAPKIFARSKFTQLSSKVTTGTVLDRTSYQYCFLGQLYNFLNVNCKVSTVFDKIPKDMLKKICLVFMYAGHYLFWMIDTLVSLNQRNQIYFKLFNHINGFILQGILEENARHNELENLPSVDTSTDEELTSTEDSIVNTFSQITKTPIEKIQDKNAGIQSKEDYNESVDTEELDNLTREIESVSFDLAKERTVLGIDDATSIVVREEVSHSTKEESIPVEVIDAGGDTTKENLVDLYQDTKPYYKDEDLSKDPVLPGVNSHLFTNPDEIAQVGIDYMKNIDEQAKLFIMRDPKLTDAQKTRALKMIGTYRQVPFDGKTIEQYLSAKIDPTLKNVANIDVFDSSKVPDESMKSSTITDLDRIYMERFFTRHMLACAASMAGQGMFLQAVEKKVTNTELTQSVEYSLRYKTALGRSHTLKFSMPIVRPDGTFLVNGVRSNLLKQLSGRPIAKITPTRVSLVSNYNKTIVEKQATHAHDYLVHISNCLDKIQEEAPNCVIEIRPGVVTLEDKFLCGFEYWKLSQKYRSIELKHQNNEKQVSVLYFGNIKERKHDKCFTKDVPLSEHDWARIEAFEEKNNVNFIGIRYGEGKYAPSVYYLDMNSELHMVGKDFHVKTDLFALLQGVSNVSQKKGLTEWTDIKILDAKFPVGFLLCYRFGLLNVLRRLNVKYRKINTRARWNPETNPAPSPSDIVLKFAKGDAIVIPRYPLKTSFILQGLAMFNTQQALMEDFEHKDVYYQLLLDKRMGAGRTNYLIGIDDTFDMFVDVMTYERLKQLGEPTTFDGLLVRATEMLTYPWHDTASSIANHVIRSYERFNSILYREMTSAMRLYKRQRGSSTTFSMNPNAVLQSILQDPSVGLVEDINPIHDIQNTTRITFLGSGGRTAESIVASDRRFPPDALGVLSEATPSSSKVGITTQTSMNPTIANVYGLPEKTELDDMKPAHMLSSSACFMPGLMQDDPPRAAFAGIQLAHWMPTKESEVTHLRTGFENVAAHRVTELYAVTAKEDGKVIDVNEKLKLFKIQYKSGKIETYSYDFQYGVCSDILTEQRQVITVKKGDSFKKQDVLRYNPQFFKPDPDIPRQVSLVHGLTGKVVLLENTLTFEDSNAVTEEFSKKLEICPIVPRILILPRDAKVHEFRKVGEEVEILTPLVIFERNDYTDISGVTTDDKAIAYLEKLNKTAPKAKSKGVISNVRVLYSCDKSDMSPEMRTMVNTFTKEKEAIGKYAASSVNQYLFSGSSQVPENSKYKGTTVDLDTVIFEYLIKERFDNATGDKIVIDSSLKTVTCKTLADPPVTASGKKIDCVFSLASVYNRIVNSPILVGLSESILNTLEEKIRDLYKTPLKLSKEELIRPTDSVGTEELSLVVATKWVIEKEDWNKIKETCLQVLGDSEYSQEKILDGTWYIGWILEKDKKVPVGVAEISPTDSNNCAYVKSFAIHPSYHGKGLGSRLFNYVLYIIKQKGYTWATITVRADNTPAKRIYYKAGYKQYGTLITFNRKNIKPLDRLPDGYVLMYAKELEEKEKDKIGSFLHKHAERHLDLEKFSSSKHNKYAWMGEPAENRIVFYKKDPSVGTIESVLTMRQTLIMDELRCYFYGIYAESSILIKELITLALGYKGIEHCKEISGFVMLNHKYFKDILSLGTIKSEQAYLNVEKLKIQGIEKFDPKKFENISFEFAKANKENIAKYWDDIKACLSVLWDNKSEGEEITQEHVLEERMTLLLHVESANGKNTKDETRVVGTVKYEKQSKTCISVSNLTIHPELQGQGVGSEFFRLILKNAKNKGYLGASLWVRAENERAAHIYHNAGFKPFETIVLIGTGTGSLDKLPEGYAIVHEKENYSRDRIGEVVELYAKVSIPSDVKKLDILPLLLPTPTVLIKEKDNKIVACARFNIEKDKSGGWINIYRPQGSNQDVEEMLKVLSSLSKYKDLELYLYSATCDPSHSLCKSAGKLVMEHDYLFF